MGFTCFGGFYMRSFSVVLLLLCGVLVAGCGGGEGGGATISSSSPFAGTWSGPWTGVITSTGAAEKGTFDLVIVTQGLQNGGLITGSGVDPTASFTVSGNITSAGVETCTFFYPAGAYTSTGTLSIAAGQLTGTITDTISGVTYDTRTINLTKQ